MVNTVESYRSPVRLIKHAAEDAGGYSSQSVARARKKLMAEIALSGDEIIIDGVPYSRNDASTLLDVMTEEAWKMHSVIYAHKGLLDFLEKEVFNDDEIKKADAWLYNEKFVQAVSPCFAHSFNAVSGRLLKAGDFAALVKLLNYKGYILPEHSGEGYQKLRTYLDDLSYTVRNLSWEKFVADESILHFVFSGSWKEAVNKLPSSFTAMRDEVVEGLINVVLRFQHKATWHYLHQLLVQLRSIETNDFNRSEVERIDKVISHNSHLESSGRLRTNTGGNKGEWASGRAVWWVIWVILAIVRAATCNDRSTKNSYNFTGNYVQEPLETKQNSSPGRATEQQNEKHLFRFLDSFSRSKKIALQSLPEPIKTGNQPLGTFADLPSNEGPCKITINNNTAYNCVLLYFNGPAPQGSVYQGSLSHTVAVYIKKGDAYVFNADTAAVGFHFLFGGQWGRLKDAGELFVSNHNQDIDSLRIPVYEFFESDNRLFQKYLRRGIHLEHPSDHYGEKDYRYLNKPPAGSSAASVEITLRQKNNAFFVTAQGGLAVKEDR